MSNLTIPGKNVSPAFASKFSSVYSKVERMKSQAAEQATNVMRTGICCGTGFGLGFVEGRYDRDKIMGAPLYASVGVGAKLVAFGLGGQYAEHLHSVGDAALSIHSCRVGVEMGRERKQKANQPKAA